MVNGLRSAGMTHVSAGSSPPGKLWAREHDEWPEAGRTFQAIKLNKGCFMV